MLYQSPRSNETGPIHRRFFMSFRWGEPDQKNLKLGHFEALDVGGTRVRQSKSAGRLMGSGATAMGEKTS
jgi:hypothetical protein